MVGKILTTSSQSSLNCNLDESDNISNKDVKTPIKDTLDSPKILRKTILKWLIKICKCLSRLLYKCTKNKSYHANEDKVINNKKSIELLTENRNDLLSDKAVINCNEDAKKNSVKEKTQAQQVDERINTWGAYMKDENEKKSKEMKDRQLLDERIKKLCADLIDERIKKLCADLNNEDGSRQKKSKERDEGMDELKAKIKETTKLVRKLAREIVANEQARQAAMAANEEAQQTAQNGAFAGHDKERGR